MLECTSCSGNRPYDKAFFVNGECITYAFIAKGEKSLVEISVSGANERLNRQGSKIEMQAADSQGERPAA